MSMLPHTITLYNQDGEGWRRTVLRGVLWEYTAGTTQRKTGIAPADGIRLIIPCSVHGYAKPRAWSRLNNKRGSWTLSGGDKAALGEHGEVERTQEFADMDDVITLTAIDVRDFGGNMAHFEVSGK